MRAMNETTFADRDLTCMDCGVPFIWTAGQQLFFADKQLQPPKRCAACRRAKRQLYADAPQPDHARD